MRIASKLALPLTLSLAALALAAAAAYATTTATTTETGTAAETGAFTASERGPAGFSHDAFTLTCTQTTVSGTIENIAKTATTTTVRATIDVLTFDSCQDSTGTTCTFTVDGNTLPATAWVTFTGTTPEGHFTLKDGQSVTIRIECGAFVTCEATWTTAMTGDVFNGDPGRLTVLTNTVILTGFGCDTGTGTTPVWDSEWTIDTTSDGTHTTTTLSA